MAVNAWTDIARKLRGQTLRAPDLRPIHENWTFAMNINYNQLTLVIDEQLEELVSDKVRLLKARRMDFAYFTCCVWPFVEYEVLVALAKFSLWMFLWDDEVDDAVTNCSDPARDIDAGNTYRQASIDFVRFHLLGSSSTAHMQDAPPPRAPTLPCRIFADCSPAFRRMMDVEQRERFFRDLAHFMMSTGREQEYRLSGTFPTCAEYDVLRLGTSCVLPVCDVSCAASLGGMTSKVASSEDMEVMRVETMRLTCWFNDLYSLKKEVRDLTLVNIVPIKMVEAGKDLDCTVKVVVKEIYESASRFAQAASNLRESEGGNGDIEKVVSSIESFITGFWHWSELSERYGMRNFLQKDGSLVVII